MSLTRVSIGSSPIATLKIVDPEPLMGRLESQFACALTSLDRYRSQFFTRTAAPPADLLSSRGGRERDKRSGPLPQAEVSRPRTSTDREPSDRKPDSSSDVSTQTSRPAQTQRRRMRATYRV